MKFTIRFTPTDLRFPWRAKHEIRRRITELWIGDIPMIDGKVSLMATFFLKDIDADIDVLTAALCGALVGVHIPSKAVIQHVMASKVVNAAECCIEIELVEIIEDWHEFADTTV